jgi:NTE family protein
LPDALPRALSAPPRPRGYDKAVALVLQGGGALGSYQAGVYEALAGSDYIPDWVAGISIGAINAAIIAGNAPERRVPQLRRFWETVTAPVPFWPEALGGSASLAAWRALLLGQPGFFTPRPIFAWLQPDGPVSVYDTAALRSTLESVIDFDRINARELRFSIAAVDVESGNFAWFDNASAAPIRVEHVMASGALPPGFPPVEIDGHYYWDGGLVSNTPLQYVLDYVPRRSRLTFQVDLFPAQGRLPATLLESTEREKDIRYSSRTRFVTDMQRERHDLRHNINALWDRLPAELRETAEAQFLYNFGCVTTMDIVQLIDRSDKGMGHDKDYEFSRATMESRWARGRQDAEVTLTASPWLAPMPPDIGARSFDVLAGRQKP